MMATVPHVTSGLGLSKFQADGFLLTRMYRQFNIKQSYVLPTQCICVSYGSQNKQPLFPYTALTDWFL